MHGPGDTTKRMKMVFVQVLTVEQLMEKTNDITEMSAGPSSTSMPDAEMLLAAEG
jgi:hypothetical protein